MCERCDLKYNNGVDIWGVRPPYDDVPPYTELMEILRAKRADLGCEIMVGYIQVCLPTSPERPVGSLLPLIKETLDVGEFGFKGVEFNHIAMFGKFMP